VKGKWLTFAIFFAAFGSAVMLVQTRFESRQSFVELGQLQNEGLEISEDHGRLQLERGSVDKVKNLELVAVDELKMHSPKVDEVIIVRQ